MSFITRIFWNSDERRIRSLWRLVAQGVVWFVTLFISQIIIGIVAGVLIVLTQNIPPEQFSDPQLIQDIVLNSSPVMLLIQLVALLVTLHFKLL